MSETTQCSRGWGTRCPASRGARCTCACGGKNHGNPEARAPKGERGKGGRLRRDGGLTKTDIFRTDFDNPPTELQWREGAPTEGSVLFSRDGEKRVVAFALADGVKVVEHRWVVHSPDGFEWGYAGSGPAECALNLLGEFVSPPQAWQFHQSFKSTFIAGVPTEGGDLSVEDISDWLEDAFNHARAEVR